MIRSNTTRKGATWNPRRTTRHSRVNNAAQRPPVSSFGTRKTANSARHFTAGSSSKKKGKRASKPKIPTTRIPFPNRLDERSYITKSGRVRLYGADMTMLREQVFMRSEGRCEAELHHPDCPREVTWNSGELAHKKHGANKTDTLDGTEFRSRLCHQIMQHAGKKPQGVK